MSQSVLDFPSTIQVFLNNNGIYCSRFVRFLFCVICDAVVRHLSTAVLVAQEEAENHSHLDKRGSSRIDLCRLVMSVIGVGKKVEVDIVQAFGVVKR